VRGAQVALFALTTRLRELAFLGSLQRDTGNCAGSTVACGSRYWRLISNGQMSLVVNVFLGSFWDVVVFATRLTPTLRTLRSATTTWP